MRKIIIILSVLMLILDACWRTNNKAAKCADIQDATMPNNYYYLYEEFVDSIEIGKKGHNKVEIYQYVNDSLSDCFVRIFFYKKGKFNNVRNTDWWFGNNFIFDASQGLTYADKSLFPKISDFNNDGYNDFTYHSIEAARGGNDVRKLFIYDPKNDEFIYIKNSENYPNLKYNKELDCITSYILTGTQDEYFLKLENDLLFEIARIEINEDSIFVYEYVKKEAKNTSKRSYNNDNEKLIERRENTFGDFPFFINYKPLTIVKE